MKLGVMPDLINGSTIVLTIYALNVLVSTETTMENSTHCAGMYSYDFDHRVV